MGGCSYELLPAAATAVVSSAVTCPSSCPPADGQRQPLQSALAAAGNHAEHNTAAGSTATACCKALHLHCHPQLLLQLYDIEIDRINKPYLPLAAGDFSVPTGWALVVATGAASLAIGAGEGCGRAGWW